MILKFLCCFLAFVQVSSSLEIQRAQLEYYNSQRIVVPRQQYQHQHTAPTILKKEIYYFSNPEYTTVLQETPNNIGLQQKYQTIQKTIYHRPLANLVKYPNTSRAQRLQPSLIQKYGEENTYRMQQKLLPPVKQYGRVRNNRNLQIHPVLEENTPVSKDYAMNFLPTGIDVVPGSSYIPLIKK